MTATLAPPRPRTAVGSVRARRAAVAVAAGLGGLVLFQLALAAGAPLGRAAWGGERSTLPTGLRVATVVPIAIYVVGALIVLRRAGFPVRRVSEQVARRGSWVLATVLVLSSLANVASTSDWERFLMAPLALVLGGLTFVVASRRD